MCLIPILLAVIATALGPHAAVRATPSAWTYLPSNTTPPPVRSQFGMAADQAGTVYVYGGRAADGTPLGDFWRLRPQHQTWEQLLNTAVPPLVEPHLAVDAAGNVFEFGGTGDPSQPHMSADGHSYGFYEYLTAAGVWFDLTPNDADPEVNWPGGREDHGFAYDAQSDAFFVFAGEGPGDGSLNDMWSFSNQSHVWRQIIQSYAGGVPIDPREIYNVSDDGQGHLYLFGGAYLEAQEGQEPAPLYVNDLWRFSIATSTWSLLAGQANGYDPSMPLPRHYYAQACDAAGDFYILDGYLSDTASPPFFSDDLYAGYAQPVTLANGAPTGGYTAYGLDDFWQFSSQAHQWVDLRESLGDLAGAPSIPYAMVSDPVDDLLITFGGFHLVGAGRLAPSAGTWTYATAASPADAPSGATVVPAATPATPPAGGDPGTATTSPSPTDTPTAAPSGTAVISSTTALTPTATTGVASAAFRPTPPPATPARPTPAVAASGRPGAAPHHGLVAPPASAAPAAIAPGLPRGFVLLPASDDNPPP